MDGNYFQFFAVQVTVHFYHLIPKRGILAVLPGRIIALCVVLSAQELCEILDLVGKGFLGCAYSASDAGLYKQLISVQFQDSRVAGGLYQPFNGAAHFFHAKGQVHQVENYFLLAGWVKDGCVCFPFFCYLDGNVFIGACVFLPEILLHFFCKRGNCRYFLRQHKNGSLALSWNGVVLLAAF